MSEGELYKKILGEKKPIIRRNKDSGIEEVVITGIREVLDEAKKDFPLQGNWKTGKGKWCFLTQDTARWFERWFGGAEKK